VDRKIKVFISCLLIGIPVVTGITAFFVHQAPQSENLIKPKSHMQTMYIFPKGLGDARQLYAFDMKASAKGIVIEHPKTPPPVTSQAGSSAQLLQIQNSAGSAVIIDNPSTSIIN
jgi:hypothetical protein